MVPITVNANIMCNDGTESPTCTDCHRGCCSNHGGCVSDYNENNYNNYESEEYEDNDLYISESEEYEKESEDDELLFCFELALWGVAGVGAYKVLNKKR